MRFHLCSAGHFQLSRASIFLPMTTHVVFSNTFYLLDCCNGSCVHSYAVAFAHVFCCREQKNIISIYLNMVAHTVTSTTHFLWGSPMLGNVSCRHVFHHIGLGKGNEALHVHDEARVRKWRNKCTNVAQNAESPIYEFVADGKDKSVISLVRYSELVHTWV